MKTTLNKPTRRQPEPILRFSPYAWAKLIAMRDCRDSEVGAFGITSADDLLLVEDIVLVKQKVSWVTVAFEDESVADFFEQQVDLGRKPEQFARIWLHTHPGDSPNPSMTDEETFSRVFGSCDWSVMCIIDQNSNTYARMRFGVGPGGQIKLAVAVDYSLSFAGSDFKAWKAEYLKNIKQDAPRPEKQNMPTSADPSELSLHPCDQILEQFEQMQPQERQLLMDELASQSIFWDEETEVFYG